MSTRLDLAQSFPEAYKAIMELEMKIQKSDLTPIHKELIKVRVSQINGCAFCLNMHTQEALKIGETAQRLFLLNAWKETQLFTAEEKAILQLAEEVTLIHQGGVADSTYTQAVAFFGESYTAQLIMAVITINTWNRIAISTAKDI
ncbi:carboxymuconolactone decarboxylase family protein [Flavobacterium sp. JP2137]|uniref:carboxymuconolactone decarboxylase family protein n=1 Tax=Flavobacterium sp. JP2137 TaxID=3414510 RepID=UPI003D2FE4CF